MTRQSAPRIISIKLLIMASIGMVFIESCCPVIYDFHPESAPPGSNVTIEGERFENSPEENTVKFDGVTVPTEDIAMASESMLIVKVPAGATTGPISVRNRFCTGTSSDSFLVIASAGLPDIFPAGFRFDPRGSLLIDLKNMGTGEVPQDVGRFQVYVDGRLMKNYRFSDLSDQSFRTPGGFTTVNTQLRMARVRHRLAISVDPDDEIEESNEFQNTLSRTVQPPMINGPDLIIDDLELLPGPSLRVTIRNIGTRSISAGKTVRLEGRMDDRSVTVTISLPIMTANGGTHTSEFSLPDVIGPNSLVSVDLLSTDPLIDIDNTNNYRQENLSPGSILTNYIAILNNPTIRDSVVWQGIGGQGPALIQSYSQWNPAMKNALRTLILRLENGDGQRLASPPALLNGSEISAEDAWEIYLSHVAQSLWVEVHRAVPWRLSDLTADQLAPLFDSRKIIQYVGPSSNRYKFQMLVNGDITAWNPRVCYEFLKNLGMVKQNQLETIQAITNWMRGHLSHIFASDDREEIFEYAGPPPVDKTIYPLEGKYHLSTGCWGVTGLYAALLRSINIPVRCRDVQLNDCLLHSRPEFPTVNLSLVHGDDVYTSPLIPSGAVVPVNKFFYSPSEFTSYFISPIPDCEASVCNSICDQASYNHGKINLQLAYDYMADFLLNIFANSGADSVDDQLRGPRIGGTIVEFVKPYFSELERTTMVNEVRDKIIEIGGGDLETGKQIVIRRRHKYLENR